MTYQAQVEDIVFALEKVAGLGAARDAGIGADLGAEDVRAIVGEAARFAETTLAPLNAVGDREPTRLENGVVTTAPGWREAYRLWIDGGWGTLTGNVEHGGQGLPMALQTALCDIWNQANASFALNPILTVGAIEALEAHASEELKALYLPNLIAGTWTGTMNLTEPQAGSDVGALKTRAVPDGDRYRLFGQKIFISYGEHDLSDNIVHLVLARLPDAPDGTRGISLFLVPKFLVEADGTLGARNDVTCVGLEHKLGIHASPTCTMAYGDKGEGAIGYLIGAPHQGLRAMFTMMNNARVQVGVQGMAIAERARQQALAFAKERRQGRASGATSGDSVPIIAHPDVARMLLSMQVLTEAARFICYSCAVAIDRACAGGSDAAFWQARADLLTPIAKAFSTDIGVEVASIGIQVHGGMGFVEETGAAQYYRDARVFPIYEGTNGIQAIDLVRRKIGLEDGRVLTAYLDELSEIAHRARGANRLELSGLAQRLDVAIEAVASAAHALQEKMARGELDEALAGATPFLRAMGTTAGGAYLCNAALLASKGNEGRRAALAQFYAEAMLVTVPALTSAAVDGASDVLAAAAYLEA
ncbi:acyl-CoA dehydrogenase [Acuticoccus sp. M5D2P5]|uniref:acyl-CoA dehydrogenase n=1 Tax=Acuticoccus kalidii TaxID=2910977 RepID=UPI001F39228F|nr:acyl-CoA dehydrogenase [Acuticoccus kalidii]MCF3934220.1 acyl-CoA dehydrogenase [Acuticoccus kalidii]